MKEVKAMGIRKKFLHKEVFPKYPKIAQLMKKQAQERYEQHIQKPVVRILPSLISYSLV